MVSRLVHTGGAVDQVPLLYGVIGKAVVFLCCNPFYLRHLNSLLLNSRCVPTAAGVCGLISFNRPTRPVTSSAYSVAPSARNRKLSWSNTNRSPCCDPVCRRRRVPIKTSVKNAVAAGAFNGLPRELRTRHNMRTIYCENRNGATQQMLVLRSRPHFPMRGR